MIISLPAYSIQRAKKYQKYKKSCPKVSKFFPFFQLRRKCQMWIINMGKYGLGVVLGLLGVVPGVIQDETSLGLGHVTFSVVLSILCSNLYNSTEITIMRLFCSSFSPLGAVQGSPRAVSGVIRADIFSGLGQVTFRII